MFSSGTQKKHWLFTGETELSNSREETNKNFIKQHCNNQQSGIFLTVAEERIVCRHFEYLIREFCNRFQPPMPKYVLGTACNYFKRFYLNNSVMDYHPKDIMLTCVYLACKVEEFNVSIGQFVSNMKGDREKYSETILGFELLLMQRLHYHLTIHNPYRPLEGLLIDLKTRSNVGASDIEKLRPVAEEFLDKWLNTDACLIFPPSQVALTAIIQSASKESLNFDSYITGKVMKGMAKDDIKKMVYQIKRIKYMVNTQASIPREQLHGIMKKLDQCRNQENNPDSEIYQRKMQELLEDEEEIWDLKQRKIRDKESEENRKLLGFEAV